MADASAASASAASSSAKPRSCAACRTRKVRCDKLTPCSNCKRGGIPCEIQPRNSKPRWARQFERKQRLWKYSKDSEQPAQQPAEDVIARLQQLEALVSKLGSQVDPQIFQESASNNQLHPSAAIRTMKKTISATEFRLVHQVRVV